MFSTEDIKLQNNFTNLYCIWKYFNMQDIM